MESIDKDLLGLSLSRDIDPDSFSEKNLVPNASKLYKDMNPFEELKKAIELENHNYFLIIFGDNDCRKCNILDEFMNEDPEIKKVLEENFTVLYVDYSYREFIRKFAAEMLALPWISIINKEGELVYQQRTTYLEKDKRYNKELFIAFLQGWKINSSGISESNWK
jgi:hypothetical protein